MMFRVVSFIHRAASQHELDRTVIGKKAEFIK